MVCQVENCTLQHQCRLTDTDLCAGSLPTWILTHIKTGYCSTINYLQGPLTQALAERRGTALCFLGPCFPSVFFTLPPRMVESLFGINIYKQKYQNLLLLLDILLE